MRAPVVCESIVKRFASVLADFQMDLHGRRDDMLWLAALVSRTVVSRTVVSRT